MAKTFFSICEREKLTWSHTEIRATEEEEAIFNKSLFLSFFFFLGKNHILSY